MTQTPITELDFFQIKEQLKAYLRGQDRFKDYDFEGSNLSVLLDVLSYNTYQNNFYTNMAISEMFLDSAILEGSVMSHAKELNYLPRSAVSSRAEVNIRITAPNNIGTTIIIPAGQKFSTSYNGDNFTFYTDRSHVANIVNGSNSLYAIDCVPVYEGVLVSESFYLSANTLTAKISNKNVDISSIKVNVAGTDFLYASSIFGVESNANVFYLEPTVEGSYAVTFGNNLFGRQPTFNEKITVSYRVASGAEPNGAFKFTTSSTSIPNVTGINVTTYSAASGGSEKETNESIKVFAPKSIQNQERAITAKDYETLLRREFGSSVIKSVSVYGGDEMEPPRYGKVAISINPYEGTTISEGFKTSVVDFISDKAPLPIQPIFVDPDFLYAKIDVNVYYSKKLTSKSAAELESLVRQVIQNYSTTYMEDFGSSLMLSRLSSMIDAVDEGVMSNTIEANPIIDYSPPTNIQQNPQFKFSSPLIVPYAFNELEDISNYTPAIKSSVYKYEGTDVFFQDDGKGNIITLSSNLQKLQVLNPVIGTVNYSTGTLNLVKFTTSGYTGNAIKIYANTTDKNIVSPKSRVFSIRDSDVIVTMIETK